MHRLQMTGKYCRLALLLLCCLFSRASPAQQYDTVSVFDLPIQLDTFVIHTGFDVDAFIRRIKTDTTFFKAFKNMRFLPYTAVNNVTIYDKHSAEEAAMHSRTRQHYKKPCRYIETQDQKTTGSFYDRKGHYNYYTAELFAYLFLPRDTICNETDVVAGYLDVPGGNTMEKRKQELKQLIFNPGSRISGIPFMGDRASIFDEPEKYNFKIQREMYDGQDCLVFRITPKPGYERKVVYNELVTWFRKTDYSILARDYSLSYSTMVYDFSVRMRVRTALREGKLYPTFISYDGHWHVFTKKRERARFDISITY